MTMIAAIAAFAISTTASFTTTIHMIRTIADFVVIPIVVTAIVLITAIHFAAIMASIFAVVAKCYSYEPNVQRPIKDHCEVHHCACCSRCLLSLLPRDSAASLQQPLLPRHLLDSTAIRAPAIALASASLWRSR